MPHIFPRRFLRTRDILDPADFNADIQPADELIHGRLDRTNFSASSLKTNLRTHPDELLDGSEVGDACVAEGAYFNIHSNSIESRYHFLPTPSSFAERTPPNFVEFDGKTFRYPILSPSSSDGCPSVVGNDGSWAAVRDHRHVDDPDSGPQQLTFTTGQSKVWISAYVQYIWQGFYEPKRPWISGERRFKGETEINFPDEGDAWGDDPDELLLGEKQVLNSFGPSKEWESVGNSSTELTTANYAKTDEQFSFALNEPGESFERANPNACGMHHISRGRLPSLVQFALRVDGKIIEETITGKRLPFEESSHGLSVSDSIPTDMDEEEDDEAALDPIAELLPDFNDNSIYGQRSVGSSSGYGDSPKSRPGQKVRASRAVSCGPEVMPVRIGAVVELPPGEHTIEIVARRLERKKGQFKKGNFVGVFSRRIVAFDLPIYAGRQENALASGEASSPEVKGFMTEDPLTNRNITSSRTGLGSLFNSVRSRHIDSNVLTNEYLPSKVVYSLTKSIMPNEILSAYGLYQDRNDQLSNSGTPFPGYRNFSKINNVLGDDEFDVVSGRWSGTTTASDAGWLKMRRGDLSAGEVSVLEITAPAGEQVLRPNEKLILFMDVEVRFMSPRLSTESDTLISALDEIDDGTRIRNLWRNFGRYLLSTRYLDLFALFALAYKLDGEWIIASDCVPAMINNYNWVNRKYNFTAAGKQTWPINESLEEGTGGYQDAPVWENEPGWSGIGSPGSFFINGFADLDRGPFPYTGRGNNTAKSGLGCTVPIMRVIENNTTADKAISAFAGFSSTMLPSYWTTGFHSENKRFHDGSVVEGGWLSPWGGRKMLDGVVVGYGNSRITAIKVKK
jgi:hypothetical protein